MKKLLTTILAATMAVSAVGALVACGDDTTGGGGGGGGGANNCVYYLAGSSLGGALNLGEEGDDGVKANWYNGFMTAAEVPDNIHFSAKAGANNVYELTIDLYKSDEFGILTVAKGWGDQIGGDKLSPLTDDITANISSQDNGVGGRNFHVGVAGNYTITLDTNNDAIAVSYVRNGEPTVAIHVDYDYYIKGGKVSGGNTMYVDYTKFTPNTAKDEYTLEIGMQENDTFTFATIMEQDNSQKPERTSADFTLATDANTAAAIELEMKAGEGDNAEDVPTGKFKIKGGTGTYAFKIKEDAEDKLTLSVEKKADTVPAYDYYLVTGDKSEGKNPTFDYVYTKMTLNAETGEYQIAKNLVYDSKAGGDWVQVIVVPQGAATADVTIDKAKFSIGTEYASQEYFSDQIDASGATWVATATDDFTVSIDPASMIVTVKGNHDALTYNVGLWGGMIKDWATAAVEAEIKETKDETPMTTTFVYTIQENTEFQFRTNMKGNSKVIQYADGRITVNTEHPGTVNVDAEKFSYGTTDQDGNFKCLQTGTYKIKVTIDNEGYVTNITISDMVYGVIVKGSYGNNSTWDVSKCQGANAVNNVAEITVDLAVDDQFGFMVYDSEDTKKTQLTWAGNKNGGYDEIKKENYTYTFTGEGFNTEAGNITCTVAGKYKFTVTVDGTTGRTISVVATVVTE